jgi:hypothetical protein
MCSRVSNSASGGTDKLVAMVEALVARGCWRFTLTPAPRIWVSIIATGRGPARWEIWSASSQSTGGDHDVSMRMMTGFADGR